MNANSSFIDDLFELFSEEELKKAAKVMNPTIPGFTKRNIAKAPISLLKKKTIEMIKGNRTENLLKDTGLDHLKHYQDIKEFEDFLFQIQVDANLSPSSKFALMVHLFPDKYEENQKLIHENIIQGKDPFHQLMSIKPTFEKEFAVKANLRKNIFDFQQMISLFEEHEDFQDLINTHNSYEGNLKERLATKNIELEQLGSYTYLLSKYVSEWNEWEVDEKYAFLYLGLLDSFHFFYHEFYLLKEGMEKLQIKEKELHEQIKKDQDKQARLSRSYEKLKKEKKEWEKEKLQLISMTEELDNKIKNQSHQLKNRESEELKLIKKIEDLSIKVQGNLIKVKGILQNEKVLFITTNADPLFSLFLFQNQILMMEKKEWLHLDKLPESFQYKILFINASNLTTKEMFIIEDKLRKEQVIFRFLCGEPVEMIRKIIYMLEGDITHEVN